MSDEAAIRLGFFFGMLALMGVWEWRAPRRTLSTAKIRRWRTNLGIVFLDTAAVRPLLMQADKALFYAKSQGRNNIQMFSDMHTRATGYEDVDMTSRFVAAVKQNLLQVNYQPEMNANNHADMVSVEALARWHDDKYGWVSPASFIPLAENLGLINEVGRQILEQALHHFSQRSGSCSDVKLAVNVSKRQLISDDFYPMIMAMVQRFGLRPGQIKLEITESIALQGVEQARGHLQKLSDAGFTLSLDDFGTGFSSLSLVHELPFDEIKIDPRLFIRRFMVRRVHSVHRLTPEGARSAPYPKHLALMNNLG